MKWYREHFRAIIVGIILLLLLSLTVASYVNEGSNSWIGIQLGRISAFLQEPVTDAERGIGSTVRGLFQFRRLLDENEALTEENAQLRKELVDMTLSHHDLAELKRLTEAMNYIDPSANYSYVTAKVIAMDGSNWYRIFTVNAGTKNGILKDSVVINGDGLIGRVIDVGPDWAKVITVVDENNNVSFQIFRDLGLVGILSGDGEGKITGYMLDEEASVIEGDILVTSGMEIYPQGIPIGKISKITWDSDGLLHTVEIEPAVNFTNIQKVTIIMTGA
ncbi:MAG TPA: rod shape-determining protein MreC [Anaerovoracaceae bacterium]|nr:rod shape-determining protein MreC [Anaerovoracaceae bacterium]